MYPKIYLAVDNCFASKRWTTPDEWAKVLRDLGIHYVECSADTELDPLYMGEAYLSDWAGLVQEAEAKTGVHPCSLYSGHGTYSTLGLAHTDERVRRHMLDNWFKPLIRTAGALHAQLGFFAHCFSESVLQDPERYARYCGYLDDGLAELNAYAEDNGCGWLALEQMYSPNQIPFTIEGTAQMLRRISERSGRPFYFTEDVGHHQKKFRKPTREDILEGVRSGNKTLWLGTAAAYEAYDRGLAFGELTDRDLETILSEVERMPHLFAQAQDADCYQWIRQLGGYAPIMHLQQTDGVSSAHRPFTAENNRSGVIHGEKLLKTIQEAYDAPVDPTMPPRVDAIYLTLELFSGTAQTFREILPAYEETVRYWRQFIPEDGLTLDQLLARLHR